MNKILALTRFSMRSLLKQKTSYVLVIMSVLSLILALVLSNVNIADKYRLFEDVLLSSQMAIFHLSALFYSYEYLYKERLGGSFILPLASGMSRSAYLLSTFLVQTSLLIMLFAIFGLMDVIALFFIEGEVNLLIIYQLFLYLLSSIFLSALVIMFSQYVSVMNSVIYSIFLFIIGSALDEVYYYVDFILKDSGTIMRMTQFIYYLVPNFSLFDKQGVVVNKVDVNLWLYFEPILYFSLFMIIIYLLALSKFAKKVLRVGE